MKNHKGDNAELSVGIAFLLTLQLALIGVRIFGGLDLPWGLIFMPSWIFLILTVTAILSNLIEWLLDKI